MFRGFKKAVIIGTRTILAHSYTRLHDMHGASPATSFLDRSVTSFMDRCVTNCGMQGQAFRTEFCWSNTKGQVKEQEEVSGVGRDRVQNDDWLIMDDGWIDIDR